ncbi:UPF0351 protein C9orf32 -like protein [Caligus rogercresseyi]|uniref:UPF0351 protein C9orf32 -like protein n=1 Tax=Caligus rogercresseyi TaxID=217165 RepID=A0A7T8GP33_CALRO|nr:UPF0351 protein C9orf32 -like protein [Caligus rogercresseyi]
MESGIDYEKGARYWEGIDPTSDGMLGALAKVSNPELKDSSTFLKTLFKGTSEACVVPAMESPGLWSRNRKDIQEFAIKALL